MSGIYIWYIMSSQEDSLRYLFLNKWNQSPWCDSKRICKIDKRHLKQRNEQSVRGRSTKWIRGRPKRKEPIWSKLLYVGWIGGLKRQISCAQGTKWILKEGSEEKKGLVGSRGFSLKECAVWCDPYKIIWKISPKKKKKKLQ